MRVDQRIMALGLAPTRSAANRLIDGRAVRWLGPRGWVVPTKAGEDVPEDCQIEVTDDAELRWASRGGLKLDGALRKIGLDLNGVVALDVGQGTGGFTDVMLQAGAARVVGVEVGHGQLHARLAADARVQVLEKLNARDMTAASLGDAMPAGGFGFITGDLSFISLSLVLPALAPLLAPGGTLLMLVKPQFELQPAQIGKGGLVKDPASFAVVETRMWQACKALSLKVSGYFQSPLAGGDGNTEFFIWARQPDEAILAAEAAAKAAGKAAAKAAARPAPSHNKSKKGAAE